MSRAPWLVSGLWLLAATGCSTAPTQEDHYYRTEITPVASSHAPLKIRMVVEPFEVHGIYSDRPLVFLDRSGAYQQSHHNNWIEPPSVMLADSLLDTLRAAYGPESAFLPDARVLGDVTIRARLRRFERLPASEPAQAMLSLEIVVTSGGGTLIGSVDFEQAAPAGETIPDYVHTQSELLGKAYAKLLNLLDERAAVLKPVS